MVLTKFLWTTWYVFRHFVPTSALTLITQLHSLHHSLALNILDTLKAVSRPPIRPKRKYTTQQSNDRARLIEQTDEQTANDGSVRSIRGEGEGWQPTKRLKTEKRDRWRVLLQNWIAWVSTFGDPFETEKSILLRVGKAAFVQIEPFVDNSVGLFMPFYGYSKILFLFYLLVTRPSVSPLHAPVTSETNPAQIRADP
jgi:hypothetical protein